MSFDNAPSSVRIRAAQNAAMLYPARKCMTLDEARIAYFRELILKKHWTDEIRREEPPEVIPEC